ncbi:class I SAM-dependent methyltransferase, partial [Patescibacteria group bacterium AH-259-L07]|nr:class I SAM-dependent methyltransferase [Patescibacteria group bacterium AH-259-L07]
FMAKKLPKAEWDKVAEWWDTEAGDAGVWHQQNDIDPVIFNILGSVKNKKIIEIGCGNGYFARLLAKRGADVTAIDLSSKLLTFAIAKEEHKPLGIKYLIRDAANLRDLKSKSFDIGISNMSLMDIADTESAIKEMSRVLKRGNRFIFSITHPVFCDSRQQWVIIKEGGKKYFARAINKYLSSTAEKHTLWASGVKSTQYHRSVETYLRYLRSANFLISDFKEIATKKPVAKANKEHGDVKFRRSKHETLREKKMKEFAGKEIPLFLIIGALKIK